MQDKDAGRMTPGLGRDARCPEDENKAGGGSGTL